MRSLLTHRSRLCSAVIVSGFLVALASCSGGGAPSVDPAILTTRLPAPVSPTGSPPVGDPTPTPADPPTATAVVGPPVGVCYPLTYNEALAPTSDTVGGECAGDHTSQTFSVGQLDTVRAGHLLAVDSKAVQDQVSTVCPERLPGWLGGSEDDLRLSMLRAVWFTPSVEESDAGANWFRCDVVAVDGSGALAPLTGRLRGALSRDRRQRAYRMCGTAEPGTADFTRVLCRQPHSWRTTRTVDFAAGKYPGLAEVKAGGQTPCEDAGRDVAADALNFQWGYEWPTREQWRAGQTYGLCWAPDGS